MEFFESPTTTSATYSVVVSHFGFDNGDTLDENKQTVPRGPESRRGDSHQTIQTDDTTQPAAEVTNRDSRKSASTSNMIYDKQTLMYDFEWSVKEVTALK